MAHLYSPIRISRLYEKIVQAIEADILAGHLSAGDQLPSERDLAVQFGVSRTAVREAVKALREKGLLDVQPGRGTFVTNGTAQVMRHSIDWLLKANSPLGWRHLVEVREILEPEIAALAAKRAGPADLEALKAAYRAMDAALDDAEAFIEADLDFHLALAVAAQNALIPLLIDPIVDLLREQRARIFLIAGGAERGQAHHARILEAVRAGDVEAARNRMRAHLAQVREDSERAIRES